ncbi:hypothetical protein I6N98_06405 [Spongiibacter nanhainus]|uniref:Uncharacterized protein n=1 Tax=Spongiibacter nanhainus TaxID=2794344 RepID=A0A7T4URF7_9GAMM|nr:hypothetical protein [Spongiibacter nanhainus]QQD19477.1 hypothetical protein I6N98_06405 [Spongiibacter nanhainus]
MAFSELIVLIDFQGEGEWSSLLALGLIALLALIAVSYCSVRAAGLVVLPYSAEPSASMPF